MDPRDPGDGYDDPREWVRPAGPVGHRPPAGGDPRRARSGPMAGAGRGDATDPHGMAARPPVGARGSEGRPPSARASRARAPRTGSSPGLPLVPTLAVAGTVVVLAFVLGRTSAGDREVAVRAKAPREASTTTSTRETTHTVLQGESLLGIASQYGLTLDGLAAANGITNTNHVFVGQLLKIPPVLVTVTTRPVTTTTKKR